MTFVPVDISSVDQDLALRFYNSMVAVSRGDVTPDECRAANRSLRDEAEAKGQSWDAIRAVALARFERSTA